MLRRLFGSALRRKVFTVLALVITIGGIATGVQTAGATSADGKYNTSKACEQSLDLTSPRLAAFDSFSVNVNGKTIPKDNWDVSSYVDAGDKVSVTFKLKEKCANTYVAINMYQATDDHFVPSEAKKQKLAQRDGGAYGADKKYTITATVPKCYFQMDINTGWEYKPGDYTLDRRGRLVMAATGGSSVCKSPATSAKPSTTKKPTTTSTTEDVTEEETPTTKCPPTSTTEESTSTTEATAAEASATLQEVCVAADRSKSGYVANLKNTGDVKETFTITQDSVEIANSPIIVWVGQTTHVLLPFAEDQTATISISTEESNYSLTKTVTLDCLPDVSPAGATPTTEPPTTQPPTTETSTVPTTEDTTTTTSTTEEPTTVSSTEAPAEVQDTQIERSGELASTGFSVLAWVLVGGCLLAIGIGLARMAQMNRG